MPKLKPKGYSVENLSEEEQRTFYLRYCNRGELITLLMEANKKLKECTK